MDFKQYENYGAEEMAWLVKRLLHSHEDLCLGSWQPHGKQMWLCTSVMLVPKGEGELSYVGPSGLLASLLASW